MQHAHMYRLYVCIYTLLHTVNVSLVPGPCLMILHPPDSEPATPEQVRVRKSCARMQLDLRDMFEPYTWKLLNGQPHHVRKETRHKALAAFLGEARNCAESCGAAGDISWVFQILFARPELVSKACSLPLCSIWNDLITNDDQKLQLAGIGVGNLGQLLQSLEIAQRPHDISKTSIRIRQAPSAAALRRPSSSSLAQ